MFVRGLGWVVMAGVFCRGLSESFEGWCLHSTVSTLNPTDLTTLDGYFHVT